MAGTIATDVGFRVTQTGDFLRNPPKSSFQGMSSAGNFAIAPSRSQRLESFEFSRRDAQLLQLFFVPDKTPRRCHSRSRRQHVTPEPHPISVGNIRQGIPLRRTKRIPGSTARSST